MARENAGDFGLAGIFDNVRDGLVLVRFPQRRIVLFNRSASEITGIPIEKAMGTKLDSVFKAPEVHDTARLCSQEPVGVWPGHAQEVLQTHIKRRGGHDKDVELHFCRVDDVGLGGPLVLLVMRPSSEVTLDQAIRKGEAAQRRVHELEDKARGVALFFSEAAHEFNTPLTIVLLQSRLLQQALGPLAPKQERALARIDTNVHRLVLLSQDLLDLAHADAGQLLVNKVDVDLADLLQNEVRNFRDLAKQQRIMLVGATVTGPLVVKGEARRLRQVLANFIGNAVKFTPAGGRIEVRLESHEGQALVAVKDDGRGMDRKDVQQLFRPFVRIDSPELPKKPGSGLGLYLSKRIVEAHGGKVSATSPGRGKGMEFRFSVPLVKSVKESSDVRKPARAVAERGRTVKHSRPSGRKARTHSTRIVEQGTVGGRPKSRRRS